MTMSIKVVLPETVCAGLAHVQAARGASAFPTDQDLASLRAEVLEKMTTEMWADMENDTEEDLTHMCMMNFAAGED